MLLKVHDVAKRFGGVTALLNVSFEVEKGELSSIIGPNGAGKTTLFNALTGYIPKDHGRIIFDGEDITKLSPFEICRKRIGRSFQRVNIFPRFTVLQNVQIAVICGKGEGTRFFAPYEQLAREETLQILEDIGLAGERYKPAGELSYGDQKRLEIAIALANKPKLLLLDEPTAGMSSQETKVMVQLILGLVENRGISILIVEHDMDVVFSISEKIRVLYQGMIIVEGTPAEIKANKEVQRIYLGEKEL
jgi:branched-chain amino acid transport system ATP-binding protein